MFLSSKQKLRNFPPHAPKQPPNAPIDNLEHLFTDQPTLLASNHSHPNFSQMTDTELNAPQTASGRQALHHNNENSEVRDRNLRGTSAPSREGPGSSREHRELRKSSSMGSLYISTTICKPCVDSIINSVATILHSQMIEVISTFPLSVQQCSTAINTPTKLDCNALKPFSTGNAALQDRAYR